MKTLTRTLATLIAGTFTAASLSAGSASDASGTAVSAKFAEGLDVEAKNGTEIGTLDDMVIDLRDGSVDYYIVDTGVLGIGGEEKIVPARHLKHPGSQLRNFVFHGSEMKFNKVHAIDSTMSFSQNLEAAGADRMSSKNYVRAMDMNSDKIYTNDRENVGEVESWVINPDRDSAPYLIVRDPRFGMLSGPAYEYYLIDGNSIESVESNADTVHLKVNVDEFAEAPRLSETEAVDAISDREVTVFKYELASM